MNHTAHARQRFAAPAPTRDDDEPPETAEEAAELVSNEVLHAFCEAWVVWQRTRRFYGQPSQPISPLGQLVSKGTGRGAPGGGPDAECSAELKAFDTAYTCQPRDALDVQAFTAYYLVRTRPIKRAAANLNCTRQHFYRLLHDCRQRIYLASRQVLEKNLMAARSLASRDQ